MVYLWLSEGGIKNALCDFSLNHKIVKLLLLTTHEMMFSVLLLPVAILMHYIWLESAHTHSHILKHTHTHTLTHTHVSVIGEEGVFMCSIKILQVMIWSCSSSCCCCHCCCRLLFQHQMTFCWLKKIFLIKRLWIEKNVFDKVSININFIKVMFTTTLTFYHFEWKLNFSYSIPHYKLFCPTNQFKLNFFQRFEQTSRTISSKFLS